MTLKLRAALALACVGLSASLVAQGAQPTQNAQPVLRASVTFAHFNDVYEIGPVENGKIGGLARVATVLDRLRKAAPPVLVTLGGDYLSPSAIGTARVNGEALAGRQMVDVLNTVGLQYATLGNHEFDVSESAFKARMAESKFTVIVSNVTDSKGQRFEHTVDHLIVPVKSGGRTLNIGFIGVVIDSNKKAWVQYQNPIAAARAAIAPMIGKVDAIVVLSHLALDGDALLAESIPEIDLILSGHEHENWQLRRGRYRTLILKADANVRSLAIATMTFGAKGARPTVSSRLEEIDDRIPNTPTVDTLVTTWTNTAFDAFRRDGLEPTAAVTRLPEPLDARDSTVRNIPGPMTEMIADAMQRETGAELGVFNGGSIRIDDILPAGPITEYDIIRVLPFGGRALKVDMDGVLLARVLNIGRGNQGTGGYLHSSQNVTRAPSGAWVIDGKPIDPERRYTVGISDFLMTGGETNLDFLTRTNPAIHSVVEFRDVRRAVIDELKRRYPVR